MNRWIVAGLAAVIATLLHTQLFLSGWGSRMEPSVTDAWFNLRGNLEPPENVVLVAMDEQSYTQLDVPLNQPWPRGLHAQLLERLQELGAKRVIFDVLFLGAGTNPASDTAFAEALKKVPVTLGADSGGRDLGTGAGSFSIEELLTPYAPFERAAANIALVSLPEDDGHLRRFQVTRSQITKDIPTLSEAGAGVQARQGGPGPRDMIWYYGRPGTIPTVSYYQILEKERPLPRRQIEGKIVFVGLALRTELGPAQKDTYLTPFYERGSMFGVEIHATATENILTNQWIKRLSVFSEVLLTGLATLLLSGAIFRLRPQWGAIVIAGFEIGWIVLSYVLFTMGMFLPGAILCAVILPVGYLASTLYYYIRIRRSHIKIESAFEHYLSPEMARELANNPRAATLGGEKLWATALFTDIEHFTDITEEMPAEKVSAMLNAYFTVVADAVFLHQGTLIKFIGDAIFVLWGAPVRINNHAEKAVTAAIEVAKVIARFNATGQYPALNTRIGINTGPMVIGNLGATRRFDYTAIGDSVNLASRIEGINKYLGTGILLTESVRKEIGNLHNTFELGAVRVAGKKEPVGIYTIFDPQVSSEARELWTTALKAWNEKRFTDAVAGFQKIGEVEKRLTVAAELYISEASAFLTTPPSPEWRGELQFSKK